MSAACPRFGFTVEIALAPRVSQSDAARLRQEFSAILDATGLTHADSERATWRYLVSREAGQATNADREAIVDWAARQSSIASFRIGDLIDLRD